MNQPLVDYNGLQFSNTDEECHHLIEHHFGTDNISHILDGLKLDTEDDRDLTAGEIIKEFRSLSDKAPGPYGFDLKITSAVFNNFKDTVLELYLSSFRLRVFPDSWKKAKIILIPKPDKGKYDTPDSFRPISLIPTFGKVLEKLIKSRLIYHLQTNSLLSATQCGFLPNRSTSQATEMLVEAARGALSKQRFCVAVALDIKGAFDNVKWSKIVDSLNEKRVPLNLKIIICSYLDKRMATLAWQGSTRTKMLSKGCPQGSALSPYLWLLVVDGLLQRKFPSSIKVVAYADDILVIAEGQDLDALNREVNKSLEIIYDWSNDQQLSFSLSKCTSILFTRRLNYTKPKIVLNGIDIPIQDSFKYLGLIIDNRLTWNKHINYVCSKAVSFLFVLRRISRNTWGASGGAVKTMYKAAIKPMITYNCQVWAQALKRKYNLQILKRTERLVAINIIKSYRDISYEAAMTLSGLVPLEIDINRINNIYHSIKSKTLVVNNISYEIEETVPDWKVLHPGINPPIWINQDLRPKTTHLNTEDINTINEHIVNIPENVEKIKFHKIAYTDGSKSDEGVGSAYVISAETEAKFKLSSHCNIFQAELLAIYKLLKYLKISYVDNLNVLIVTDSLSSVYAIVNRNFKHDLVRKIIKNVDLLKEVNCKVYLEWVRSHSGVKLNDQVDQLAKLGTNARITKSYTKIPIDYVKSKFKLEARQEYQKWYDSLDSNIRIKKLLPKVSDLVNLLGRHRIGYFESQVLTGHGHYNAYLYRRNIVDAPYCECDEESDQTAEHLLFNCISYVDKTTSLISKLSKDKIPLEISHAVNSKHSKELFRVFGEIYQKMMELQS